MPALRADDRSPLLLAVAAMAVVVLASNILVQHPIRAFGLQDWLTWGAFTYPLAFLVTDLMNRLYGPGPARQVVFAGFILLTWFHWGQGDLYALKAGLGAPYLGRLPIDGLAATMTRSPGCSSISSKGGR